MRRRDLLAATAALSAPLPARAQSNGWRTGIRELGFGVIPVETQTQTTESFDAFIPYASQKLGVPVRLFTASDFIGVNNALIARQIHFAWTSPSAFSGSWLECQCVEPLVAALDKDGNLGYNSILIVRAESPFQTSEELRGKRVALTEPNSNSGYLIPYVEFAKAGRPLNSTYAIAVSGGHTQSVLGLLNGQYDAAFTWTTRGHGYGQIRTMLDRGMLRLEQIRILWESDLVPAPPIVVRADAPAGFKEALAAFFVDLHRERPDLARAVAHGETQGFVRVDMPQYESTIAARRELRDTRRRG